MAYIYLTIAIVAEVIGTSALKASAEFTKLGPSVLVVAGYSVSFYFLSIVVKSIPLGIAYAIRSGVGIALITVIGLVVYHQSLDLPALAGLVLIIAGVIIIRVFSKAGVA